MVWVLTDVSLLESVNDLLDLFLVGLKALRLTVSNV